MLIGTVVKLHSGKGIFQLLQAFACLVESYPNIKLLYVGDGPDREQLERMVRDQGLSDRVILAGRREDVERMYAAMDIFVLASTCDEAFGMVLIEAMAMRKPVIGTAVGGIPSIIEDGVSGLLIAPDSVAALAAALKRYLQDETFRKTIAHEGERMVTYRFSDQLFGERFHRLLTADGQDCPMNENSDNA
jgi:glycosyltransferase involved in cell wall biosynthesis